jgi:hypothetical protein
VSTGAENRILAGESSHLGYAQSGLDSYEKEGVIASAEPGTLIGCGE